MTRRTTHADRQLFDYLNGKLDDEASRSVELHLSSCDECSSAAALLGALKTSGHSQYQPGHPDSSELAAFFYGEGKGSLRSKTAAHVAKCPSCADEMALYASAERAAADYDTRRAAPEEVSRGAWDMIHDWENSSFARPRPEAEVLRPEMLDKLARLLTERKQQIVELAREENIHSPGTPERPDLVPVIIVDKSGEFRGVEMFERESDPTGSSVLKHASHSDRFDNKPFHALLDFGEKNRIVVSDLIRRDSIRLQQATQPDKSLRRADYFIVED